MKQKQQVLRLVFKDGTRHVNSGVQRWYLKYKAKKEEKRKATQTRTHACTHGTIA
jgi:hypothetical protein